MLYLGLCLRVMSKYIIQYDYEAVIFLKELLSYNQNQNAVNSIHSSKYGEQLLTYVKVQVS
jgi:hypothetical protein